MYTPSSVTKFIVTVSGKDGNGCVGSDTLNVYASVLVPGVIANPNAAICEGLTMGSSLTGAVSTGGSRSYTYQWEYSDNNSSWGVISNSNTANLSYGVALNANRYFRRKTTDQGYSSYSNTVLQTVNPEPTVTLSKSYTTSTGNMPAGSSILLTATAGLASYSWTPISGSTNTLTVTPA